MATVTPFLDTRYKAKDGYPIKIRIQSGDDQKNVSIGYRVKDKEWKSNQVVKHEDAAIINSVLWAKIDAIKRYFADCAIRGKKIDLELAAQGKASHSFCEYLIKRADQYKNKAQIVMSQKLRRFAKELKEWRGRDVDFDDLNASTLRDFEAWLIDERKNTANTRHKKYKFLRQFYNNAIDEDLTSNKNPFAKYSIVTTPVKKEKLSLDEIAAIEGVDLANGPVNDARNLFLFSYYVKGSRFENCITFRRDQIREGRIYIHMNKGKKHVSVKIHGKLQGIINQYPDGELLFPFIKNIPEDPADYRLMIGMQNVMVNRSLKLVAAAAGVKVNLTFHMARHSFAQHLKEVSSNIHVIQQSLGHSNSRTTEIYLKALGDEALDAELDKLYT